MPGASPAPPQMGGGTLAHADERLDPTDPGANVAPRGGAAPGAELASDLLHLTGLENRQRREKLGHQGHEIDESVDLARKTMIPNPRPVTCCCCGRRLSTVTNTSKRPVMASSRSPLSRSPQPISCAVDTS